MDKVRSQARGLAPTMSERVLGKRRGSVEVSTPAMPISVRGKFNGVRIRNPCICKRCRRFKLQGFFGSFPPKNFCICSSDFPSKLIYTQSSAFKFPSTSPKSLVATGYSLPNKYIGIDDKSLTPYIRTEHNKLTPCNENRKKTPYDGIEDMKIASCVEGEEGSKICNKKFLIFQGNNSKVLKNLFLDGGEWVEGDYSYMHETQFIWQPVLKNINFKKLGALQFPPLINHFENHFEISDKFNLFTNLSTYCKKHNLNISSFVPTTFLVNLKSNKLTVQTGLFMNCFRTLRGETKGKIGVDSEVDQTVAGTHYIGKNIWLIKPADNNRGRGIKIFNTLAEFKSIISKSLSGEGLKRASKSGKLIIQKYVESPLLINQRKFDIRIWVLITPNMKAYYYPEGYIRTSSELFSLDESMLSSSFVHLTNNAIQKESSEYSKYEPGNQLSFSFLKSYFSDNLEFDFDSIMNSIKSQLCIAINSTIGKMNPGNYKFSFEIFGFDFIIDSNFKPWLIECNSNPCLELSSPLLNTLIPEMLSSALTFLIPGPLNSSNKWEYLQTSPT